jgi:hypothetical protein
MVIALGFFKRIFTRSLPMNQAHGSIIAEVYGTRWVSTHTTFAQPRLARGFFMGSDFVSVVKGPGQSTPASAHFFGR